MPLTKPALAVLLIATLPLSACGEKDGKDLSKLDARLAANAADPALREALETPIATDPDLHGEANRDAVRPADRPLTGAVPARMPAGDPGQAALRLAGGKLMKTPEATKTITSTKEPVTLGGIAAARLPDECATVRVSYDMSWADELPRAFPLYPAANLIEAAGADRNGCAIRAASFASAATPGDILDFYYTLARRSGHGVSHVTENGRDVLSGTGRQGAGAFYIAIAALPEGGATVDLAISERR